MDPQPIFIKLKKDHLTINSRTYPADAVVEVDKTLRKRLVEHGFAEDHPGPASQIPRAKGGPEKRG